MNAAITWIKDYFDLASETNSNSSEHGAVEQNPQRLLLKDELRNENLSDLVSYLEIKSNMSA